MSSPPAPTLRSLFLKGGAGSLILNLFALLIAFASQVILARFLGVEGFGNYSFLLSLLTVALVLSTLGLDAWLVRSVPKRSERGELGFVWSEFRAASRRVLWMSVLVAAAIAMLQINLIDKLTLLTCALFFILWNQNIIRQSVLRGLHRPVSARLPDIILRPLILILTLILLRSAGFGLGGDLPLWSAWLGQLFGAVVAFVVGGLVIRRAIGNIRTAEQGGATLNFAGARILLAYSLVLVATNEVDRLILGTVASPSEVGVYGASLRIAAFVMFAAEALAVSFAPLLSTAFSRGDIFQTQRLLNSVHRYLLVLTIPLALVVLFAKEPILAIFGRDFAGEPRLLVLLIIGQLGSIFFFTAGYALTMGGREREAFLISTTTLIVAIIALPPLAAHGLVAFAAGVAGLQWLRAGLFWVTARVKLGLNCHVLSWLCSQPKL